jgi:hypothetical protein
MPVLSVIPLIDWQEEDEGISYPERSMTSAVMMMLPISTSSYGGFRS